MDATAPVLLRPLGVGEIIDRALTLYIKNFVVFTATLLSVIFIPFAVGEYFLLSAQSGEYDAIGKMLLHLGSSTPLTPLPIGNVSFADFGLGYLFLFLGGILSLFANNAIAVNVAAIYTGRKPSLGYGLKTAFAHAGQLAILILLAVLIAAAAYVLVAVVTIGVVAGAVGAGTFAPSAARSPFLIALAVLAALGAVVALLVAASLMALAFVFAGYAIVIENRNAIDAIGSGFRRVFSRREWVKAFLVVLVAFALAIGVSLLSSTVEVLLFIVPGAALFVALWSAFFSLISAAVQTVFYAVYYYDVRIRREGFDLEAALARLPAPTA